QSAVRWTQMNSGNLIERQLTRSPLIATAVYVALVGIFGWATFGAIADAINRRSEVAAAGKILEQLQGRKRAAPEIEGNGTVPAGSPFLEGQTLTVAGAALLQRMTSAVANVGGNVLSTQVDVQGEKSKSGLISVVANCEVDQPSLQQLLYDIE